MVPTPFRFFEVEEKVLGPVAAALLREELYEVIPSPADRAFVASMRAGWGDFFSGNFLRVGGLKLVNAHAAAE